MTSRLFRPPSSIRSATLAIVALGAALLIAGPASAGLFGSDPTPPAAIPGQQDAAQQAVRLDNMEQQMRVISGRIDEMAHQIEQLQNLLKRAQEDNEFRLQQLEGGGKGQKRSEAAPPAAAPAVNPTAAAEAPMDSIGDGGPLPAGFAIDAPGTMATAQPPAGVTPGAPPAPLGTLPGTMAADAAAPSASAVGGPLDLSAIARGELAPTDTAIATSGGLAAAASQDLTAAGTLPAPAAGAAAAPQMASVAPATVDPGGDYDRAYTSIVNGDYAAAEAGFKKFLTDFPGDPRAADAQYWLGESYYSRHQYRDAATSYLATYKTHPTSQKAPDSLFKLGLSLEGLGETSAACATYGELSKKFPKAQSGLVTRVATQKQKLGCS